MKRLPIQDLIVTKSRPTTTLSLVPSFRDCPDEMVESYFFTDTIRQHFETILDAVARGAGQGFWVQAEYGAGKTHFLAALAALLTDTSDELWSKLTDESIKLFQSRFQNTHLFPVVVSLRGESQADAFTEQSLLDVVLDKGFRPALEFADLDDKVQLTAAEDLLDWLDKLAPAAIKSDVERYAMDKTRQSLAAYRKSEGNEAMARLISAYCDEHAIRPQLAAGIKSRLAHIYRQVTSVGDPRYNGLLVVVDEYEGWEKNRASPQAASQDAEFLETLAYLLPKDLGFQVHTIVASQSAVPAKLVGGQAGDRFINIPLLADRNARDYDVIVSRRVRGLRDDRWPEINDHFAFYQSNFDFAKGLSDAEFANIFPFQPRCFEVVRHITARDLPTTRSGILIFHEVINHPDLLARDTLIRVSDLLRSDHLIGDCLMTTVYKDAYNAYRIAKDALPTLSLDQGDLPLAEAMLSTLFLWYLAFMERPQPMSLRDIAQATLTLDDFMKAEDNVAYVLMQMQTLPQITFDGKHASFEPKGTEGVPIMALFNEFRKRAGDRYRVASAWTDSLFLNAQETRGQPGLFSEFTPDEATSRRVTHRNLEYAGQIIVASRWQFDWGLPLPKDDSHFRLVILTPNAAEPVKAEKLQDPRIAVMYPAEMNDEASQAAINWLAWQQMNEEYQNETSKQAEVVRDWLVTQRPTFLNALLQTHLSLYRGGEIVTRDDLGISARDAFGLASNEQRFASIIEKLLTAAYAQLPLDPARLRSTLTPAEAGKLFDGYFAKTPNTMQTAATRNYGVALGLSHPDQPARFAPQPECKAMELIAQLLNERQGGELPVWKVYEQLSGVPYGLPYVVIQLYVLAFVRHGEKRVELMLKGDHKLKTREGKPLARKQLSAATVTDLAWKPAIERAFDVLMPVVGPSWNDTVAFAREIVGDLHTSTDQTDIETQNARLQVAIDQLAKEAQDNQETLATLERTLEGTLPDEDRQVYTQLQTLLTSGRDGYATFHEQAKEIFGSADNLRDAMRVHSRLKELAALTAQINEVRRYLDSVQLRPDDRSLQVDRDSLLARLALDTLAAQPNIWGSLRANFDQFIVRYRNEYQKHHRDTNDALRDLNDALADAPRRLQALTLLNTIEELGSPNGVDLDAQYQRLISSLQPCPVTDLRAVDVTIAPVCAQCKRPITYTAPRAEAFLRALDEALTERCRRLSSEAIRRVLARSTKDAVTRFIQVVQTANVAALIDVLDKNLVQLIRELLAEDGVATADADVLRRFAQQYPTLEEADLPDAVKYLEQLLRQAFDRARKENPDKKAVRLTLR